MFFSFFRLIFVFILAPVLLFWSGFKRFFFTPWGNYFRSREVVVPA